MKLPLPPCPVHTGMIIYMRRVDISLHLLYASVEHYPTNDPHKGVCLRRKVGGKSTQKKADGPDPQELPCLTTLDWAICLSWWKVPYGSLRWYKQFPRRRIEMRYLYALSYPTTLVLQKNDGRESCSSQHKYPSEVNLQTHLLASPKGLSWSSTRLPPSFAQQPHVNWAQSQAS